MLFGIDTFPGKHNVFTYRKRNVYASAQWKRCVYVTYTPREILLHTDNMEGIRFLYVTDKTTEWIRYLNITERTNVFTGIARKERTR